LIEASVPSVVLLGNVGVAHTLADGA
jgi:hypothetical protein